MSIYQVSLCQWCNQTKQVTGIHINAFDLRPIVKPPPSANMYRDMCRKCLNKAIKNRSDELMRVQIANGRG